MARDPEDTYEIWQASIEAGDKLLDNIDACCSCDICLKDALTARDEIAKLQKLLAKLDRSLARFIKRRYSG
jgi:hypothetical protein